VWSVELVNNTQRSQGQARNPRKKKKAATIIGVVIKNSRAWGETGTGGRKDGLGAMTCEAYYPENGCRKKGGGWIVAPDGKKIKRDGSKREGGKRVTVAGPKKRGSKASPVYEKKTEHSGI